MVGPSVMLCVQALFWVIESPEERTETGQRNWVVHWHLSLLLSSSQTVGEEVAGSPLHTSRLFLLIEQPRPWLNPWFLWTPIIVLPFTILRCILYGFWKQINLKWNIQLQSDWGSCSCYHLCDRICSKLPLKCPTLPIHWCAPYLFLCVCVFKVSSLSGSFLCVCETCLNVSQTVYLLAQSWFQVSGISLNG